MLAEVRQVVLEPRTFFARLPQGASSTFPIGIALASVQLEFWLSMVADELFPQSLKDLIQIAASFWLMLPLALVVALLAPVALAISWAPIRLAAGADQRAWQIAGATFVPALVGSVLGFLHSVLPPGAQTGTAWWAIFGATGIAWPTVLVFLGVRVWAPPRALAASFGFVIIQGAYLWLSFGVGLLRS